MPRASSSSSALRAQEPGKRGAARAGLGKRHWRKWLDHCEQQLRQRELRQQQRQQRAWSGHWQGFKGPSFMQAGDETVCSKNTF